ncbi:MAG: hypothetical protein JWM59_4656 [Verrucomicrobiales bacterium]|nr:hypothetical protein [Verrucomicrobiales bacterium]
MSLTPSPQDWLVLQCPACGTRMKSRRNVAEEGTVLLCPSCRQTVTIPGAEPEPDPGRAHGNPPNREKEETHLPAGLGLGPDFPPERQRHPAAPKENSPVFHLKEGVVFEGGRVPLNFPSKPRERVDDYSGAHPEFDGSAAAENDDDGVGGKNFPRQDRRVRIKRRRRGNEKIHTEVADWNDTDLDRVQEAETAADVWDSVKAMPDDYSSDGQEYVVEGREGAPRKKVSRRRAQKGGRLFFQRLTVLSKYLTAGLGLLLAGVAVYGIIMLRKTPPSVISPSTPAPAEETIDRRVLTETDSQGAEKAVRDFLAADGVEAKLRLVRLPQHVRPLMEKWYQTHPPGPLNAGPIDLKQKTGGDIGSPGYFVILAVPVQMPDPLNRGSTVEELTFFSVEEIRKGSASTYLVDWETSTGYQEMPFETFKATMPKEAHRFRVFVKNADYYNHNFTEKDWHCVEVYYPGRELRLWGYIRRSAIEARMLLIKLESGWGGALIAELQYPENSTSRDQVVLTRMVHPSWYYAEGEEIEK